MEELKAERAVAVESWLFSDRHPDEDKIGDEPWWEIFVQPVGSRYLLSKREWLEGMATAEFYLDDEGVIRLACDDEGLNYVEIKEIQIPEWAR